VVKKVGEGNGKLRWSEYWYYEKRRMPEWDSKK